jgi:hypothetical protein
VVWEGGEALIRKSIRELADELDPESFAQIHRSVIVNLRQVSQVDRGLNETAEVKLKNRNDVLPVSRSFVTSSGRCEGAPGRARAVRHSRQRPFVASSVAWFSATSVAARWPMTSTFGNSTAFACSVFDGAARLPPSSSEPTAKVPPASSRKVRTAEKMRSVMMGSGSLRSSMRRVVE